ncbi:putative ATP-dependent RNA helicase DDX55-like protein [Frankliniella fusca]|uniref:ATP-dependent RNA helicase DDX55-like protein n=1 Tax=Frankliniella fusca TaxID=407009 RepID=A0AAE1H0R6_9NEOP|nr:putative ATP-dependent RNA helicase DDX55-like protein [Frankliniella fusca]
MDMKTLDAMSSGSRPTVSMSSPDSSEASSCTKATAMAPPCGLMPPNDVGADDGQLGSHVRVGPAEPLQRARRLVVLARQHQVGRRLGHVEHAHEQHDGRHGHDERQLPPVEVGAAQEAEQDAHLAHHLEHGAEAAADVRAGDLAHVHLRHEQHDGAAEAADEGRDEHHLDAGGEDGDEPGGAKGHGRDEQHLAAAVAHGHAAQQPAEQRAQQRQRRHPAGLLRRDLRSGRVAARARPRRQRETNFALQLKGWRENMENFCGSKPPEGGCGSRQAQGFYPLWQPTASVFHGNRRFADCDPIAQFDRFDPRTTIGLPLEYQKGSTNIIMFHLACTALKKEGEVYEICLAKRLRFRKVNGQDCSAPASVPSGAGRI